MATRTQADIRTANTKSAVKRYMWDELTGPDASLYLDCGEVVSTLLGEEALRHFDHLNLDDGPEADVWEWASEIGQKYEDRQEQDEEEA